MKKEFKMRLKFCKGDMVIISIVIILAMITAIIFFMAAGNQTDGTVIIYQDGKKIKELSLQKDTEVIIENRYINKVVIKDQQVAIVESDCPGMDCVHSGYIAHTGRSIVCLPNGVEIRIVKDENSKVDFIVR